MPITYNTLRTANGFRSPGFYVSSTGAIESAEGLTIAGLVTIEGDISSTADIITSQSLIGTDLLLSSVSIQNNVIQNTVVNQDLIININGTGTIRLQEPVTVTGLLTADSIAGNDLVLSAVSIQNNVIQNTVVNEDLIISVTGTGILQLQQAVTVTGILEITDVTDASSSTVASVILAGGLAVSKTVITGFDSYFNGVRVGRGNNSATASNIAIGASVLNAATNGSDLTGVGHSTLANNTTGMANTAVGSQSLNAVLTGNNNTAVGSVSMTNSEGSNNTAVGQNSLSIVTGNNNIALGQNAGQLLATGNANVIIGGASGSAITGTNNNIIMSDGDGNVRFQIDSAGQTSFEHDVAVNGSVSAQPATAGNHLVTNRQQIQTALAMSLFNSF